MLTNLVENSHMMLHAQYQILGFAVLETNFKVFILYIQGKQETPRAEKILTTGPLQFIIF